METQILLFVLFITQLYRLLTSKESELLSRQIANATGSELNGRIQIYV